MIESRPITLPQTVPVLREHIAKGVQESCEDCVIALAVRAVVPEENAGRDYISVQEDLVYIYQYAYSLPKEASDFIERFDGDQEVSEWQTEEDPCILEDPTLKYEPFEFVITEALPHFNRSTYWSKTWAKEKNAASA